MEYAAGFEYACDLHHEIGTEEAVAFVFCFRPRVGTQEMEPVKGVVGKNDGDQVSGFDAEEVEISGILIDFGFTSNLAESAHHDIGGEDDAFRVSCGEGDGEITFSATEVEFKDFSGIFGEKILEREVLIVQDKKIILRDSMFFCHSIKLSFVFFESL
jgi:hypothetical protein